MPPPEDPHDDSQEDPPEDPQAEWIRIKELFAEASELPESKQRDFLEAQCPDEPDLVTQVLQLLVEDRAASRHFLESPFDPVGDLSGHLLGRFFLVQRIAEGGMGIVYLARDEDTGKRAAVKILHEIHKDNRERQQLFMREARLLGELDHPNVVRILGSGEDASCFYVAMEFIEGFNLHEYMTGKVEDPAIDIHDPKVLGVLFEKLAEALDHCHARGILHRDIKPHNIMITPGGEPVLVDFGLAKEFDKTTLSLTVGFAGSLEYMSPEQALFHIHKIDHRTDIFSLGVVFYELLARHHPYRKDATETQDQVVKRIASKPPLPIARGKSDIPSDLGRIAMKALRQDREERFQTAGEMAYCLSQFRAGRRVQIPQPPLPRRILSTIKHHRVSTTVLLMLPLLIFFGIAALAQPFMKARLDVEVLNFEESGEAEVRYQALLAYPDAYAKEWQLFGQTGKGRVGANMEPGSYRFAISAGPDRFVLTQRILLPGSKVTIAVGLRDSSKLTAGMLEIPDASYTQSFAAFRPNETQAAPFREEMTVRSFWIDAEPVTTREYLLFLQERHPERLKDWPAARVSLFDHAPRRDFYELPATGMSWFEAREYAEWAGKRLPEAWEWGLAARSGDPDWWKQVDRKLINCGHNSSSLWQPDIFKIEGQEIWDSFEIVWFWHGRPCNDPAETTIRAPNGFYQAIGNISEWTQTPRPIPREGLGGYRASSLWAMTKGSGLTRHCSFLDWHKKRPDLDPLFMSGQDRKEVSSIKRGFRLAKDKISAVHPR